MVSSETRLGGRLSASPFCPVGERVAVFAVKLAAFKGEPQQGRIFNMGRSCNFQKNCFSKRPKLRRVPSCKDPSTTLSVGNAIGLAVLIAIANAPVANLKSLSHPAAIAAGIRPALWLVAAGILFSLVVAISLPSKAKPNDMH
jgi:hypothetical protein